MTGSDCERKQEYSFPINEKKIIRQIEKKNRKEKKIIMKIMKSQKENDENGDIKEKW